MSFNKNPPFYGSFNKSANVYKINLTVDDPSNFTIYFTYKLEGLPFSQLLLNNKTLTKAKLCNSIITEFKCMETSESVNVSTSVNELNWVFSYNMERKDFVALHQHAHVRIGELEVILNILCNIIMCFF